MEIQGAKIAMGPLEQTAYFHLVRAGRSVATTRILSELMKIGPTDATRLLFRLRTKGVARRIGLGKYVILPPQVVAGTGRFVGDPFVVTAQLMDIEKTEYAFAYVSAAYLHGLLDQLPQVVQAMVARFRRSLELSPAQKVRFVIVSPWKLFGVARMRYEGSELRVTDLEKTVADCVDRMDLIGGLDQAAHVAAEAGKRGLDGKKLVRYAKHMKSQFLLQRLGYILERAKLLPEAAEALWRGGRFQACPLDPWGPRCKKLHAKWQIMENAEIDFGGP